MVYPAPFHRIVLQGSIFADTFNTTLSMIPVSGTMPAATQELADDVNEFVASWWDNGLATAPSVGGLSFISAALYRGVKVNRIGTDGRYQDAEGVESVNPSPVAGISTAIHPPQCAIVGTLRGALPRARAGRGRQYWPPNASFTLLAGDGRLPSAEALRVANGLWHLYAGLNDVYLAAGINSVVGIASGTGAGAFQALDTIAVGRTIDTVRSRRNKIPEDYAELDFG